MEGADGDREVVPSVAALMDDLREAIVAAWERGLRPRTAAVHPDLYLLVRRCKATEVRRGQALIVMGMEIVPGDHVPADRPEVF